MIIFRQESKDHLLFPHPFGTAGNTGFVMAAFVSVWLLMEEKKIIPVVVT